MVTGRKNGCNGLAWVGEFLIEHDTVAVLLRAFLTVSNCHANAPRNISSHNDSAKLAEQPVRTRCPHRRNDSASTMDFCERTVKNLSKLLIEPTARRTAAEMDCFSARCARKCSLAKHGLTAALSTPLITKHSTPSSCSSAWRDRSIGAGERFVAGRHSCGSVCDCCGWYSRFAELSHVVVISRAGIALFLQSCNGRDVRPRLFA